MAIVTAGSALPEYQWWPDYFEPNDLAKITSRTATSLRWTNSDGTVVEMRGAGFIYNNGAAIEGTVSSITVKTAGGAGILTFAQVAGDMSNLFSWAFGFDRGDRGRQNGDGFNFLTALLRRNDTINGSNGGDDIVGGRNPGNDIIKGNGGGDFISGDAGRDNIDGGADWDTLTYENSFWDPTAYKGVNINVSAGTAADSWGYTDTIKNFEEFRGSKFRDTITGTAADESMMGLKGRDTLTAGNGWDELLYTRDFRFGGGNGINANLATGIVRDGWGNADTVSGFESVVGTIFNDTFIGGATYVEVRGGDGVDTYAPGAGGMGVLFEYWDPVESGVSINLSLASGQVLNDGFGNVEDLSGVTLISGAELKDTLLGDATRNEFRGNRGNDIINGRAGNDLIEGNGGLDTLTGGAGFDEFHYNRRRGDDPWGDTITDFASGTDKITFYVPDFAGQGMDATLRFNNGNSASGPGSSFFFRASDNGLYWDSDGTGANAAVLVAKLTGVTSLQATDIELFT